MSRTLLYVGTYTRPAPYLSTTNGQGIYVYSVDPANGALTYLSEAQGIDSPSYLEIDHHNRCLYAVSEVWGWEEGLCSAYRIDVQTGALSYINKQPTQGGINAYVSIDKTDHYVLAVNYWNGKSVVVFPIREDGGLAPLSDAVQHHGSGPVAARQDRSHAHCAVPDPTNKFVFVADLGIDKIMIYKLDLENGKLIPNDIPSLDLASGAGPRHFVFHPNGQFAYVIQELNSTISAMSYDSTRGALELLQTVPALPEGYTGDSHCADLHVAPSGKFLYGSNRGHDSIVIYAIDENTGRLSYVGHQSTKGKTPRNFAIDPTGAFLLAANQDSDTIVTFRIDPQTGLLAETGNIAPVPTPVCLKMIQI